jgi:hypothetical protein
MRARGTGRGRPRGSLLRPLRLVVLLGVAAAIFYAPSAWATATTYTVDNTTDATGQFCNPAGVGDCSLRSAIEHSNTNSGVDTINFDPAVFTGLDLISTITSSSATSMVISDGVNIDGGNCGGTGPPKPCVELDSNATIVLNIFTTGAVSISGMAFVGSPGSAISDTGGLPAPTVTGSWFGVGLDGTTLKGNADGITMVNTTTGGVIGGSTPATRNVFSSDDVGVNIAGNGAHAIRGNYFGTLPDGTAVSNPGTTAIRIAGGGSGVTIGGDSNNAGQCDGQCNLIVGFGQDGIFAQDAGGAPSNLTISGNFIGLGLNGTSNQGNGTGVNKGSGIELAGGGGGNDLSNVTIGGVGTKRNYIAGNTDGGIKAALTDTLNVTNNYIGLNAAATSSIANAFASPTGSGGLTDLAGTGGTIADNRFGGNGVLLYKQMTVQGNVIGVGPSGQDLGITAAEPGLTLLNNSNNVGDTDNSDAAHANTIGNVKGTGQPGILLTQGASSNTIAGNYIGTTSTGTPEPVADDGIALGGNGVMNGNSVGGSATTNANVISNSGGDAISLKPGSNGGPGNQFAINLGKNNGSGPNDIFVDLGDFSTSDGPGNPGGNAPNNSIQAPTVAATTGSISGTALPMASIFIYTTYSGHDDIRASLGSTQADGSGNWSIATPSDLFPGQCVTASQTDGTNSSEMATAAGINTGSQCSTYPAVSINAAPSDGASINDTTPQIVFSSPNDPVTFTCELNGTPIDPCDSPLDLGPLTDGDYTFTLRSAQAPSNPALGPDTSQTTTTHFTVDTHPPTVSFTSGPAEGSSTTDTSVSLGFSADEPADFECKVDGGSFSDCSSPLSLSGLAVGAHSVRVRGTDAAGNTGSIATRNFTIAAPPPPPPSSTGPTGQRAAALKKCKKKKSAKARKKCKAKAKKLPL